jgi:hypothetical protein
LLGRDSKRRKLRQRMQHELPMTEIHALGKASGSRRVERRRLRVLVEIRKVVFGGGCREELLIFAGELDVALRGLGPIGEDDECPHLVELRFDALEKPDELVVDQEHGRAGMIDCIRDLFLRQPDVHGLQDGAHHRDGEECLQKSIAVPVHHADGVAGANAEHLEAVCQSADPVAQLGIGQPPEIPIHDLLIRGLHHRCMQQLLDQQRIMMRRPRDLDEPAGHHFLLCIPQRIEEHVCSGRRDAPPHNSYAGGVNGRSNPNLSLKWGFSQR